MAESCVECGQTISDVEAGFGYARCYKCAAGIGLVRAAEEDEGSKVTSEVTPRFCGKCGSSSSALDDRFCRSCGASLAVDTVLADETLPAASRSSGSVTEPADGAPVCANCGAERVGNKPYCVKCAAKWPDGTPAGPERVKARRAAISSSLPVAVGAAGPSARPPRHSWWQSQFVIVATMIVFFPVGLILMWLYAPWSTRTKWIWSGVFGALVAIGIASAALGGKDHKNTSVQSVKGATSPTSLAARATSPRSGPTIAPTAPPPSWQQGGAVSIDTVKNALSHGKEMTRSLDLGKSRNVQVDGDSVTVTYKANDALGETDLLTVGAETSFSAHRALFANPNVASVTIIMLADWTDQFGANSEDVTTVSTLDRATVQRIDWSGLEDRVLLDNKHVFCISDAYRIHLGIYSRLKDKGCLTGAIRA